MSEYNIRFRAAAVFLVENHILVHEVSNMEDGRKCFIPPGRGIHYEETSRAALAREVCEELSWEIEAGDTGKIFRWVDLRLFSGSNALLYPPGLLDKSIAMTTFPSSKHDYPA